MSKDPSKIRDELVERMAQSMQGFNAISKFEFILWDEIEEREKNLWLALAKAGLIAVSIHTDKWPDCVNFSDDIRTMEARHDQGDP